MSMMCNFLLLLSMLTIVLSYDMPYVPFPQRLSNHEAESLAIGTWSPHNSYCALAVNRTVKYIPWRAPFMGPGLQQRVQIYSDVPLTLMFKPMYNATIDVKFRDDSYIYDQHVQAGQTLIVPPFRPVDWFFFSYDYDYTKTRKPNYDFTKYYSTLCGYSDNTLSLEGHSSCYTVCSFPDWKSNYVVAKFPRKIGKPTYEFFLTAQNTPEWDDVSLTTVLTIERLVRLRQMAYTWGGPISAVVFVENMDVELPVIMNEWMSDYNMRKHVDIHIVFNDMIPIVEKPTVQHALPINFLRTVSIKSSRTQFVFFVEADFLPNRGMYPSLGPVREFLYKNKNAIMIVPSFTTEDETLSSLNFPMSNFLETKQDLLKWPSVVKMPYRSHNATPIAEWFEAKDIFKLKSWVPGRYEPYYITHRDEPSFDEVYIGCGYDKISHTYELWIAGFQLYLIPDGFIIHLKHLNKLAENQGDSRYTQRTYWCDQEDARRNQLKEQMFLERLNRWYNRSHIPDPDIKWWDVAAQHAKSQQLAALPVDKPQEPNIDVNNGEPNEPQNEPKEPNGDANNNGAKYEAELLELRDQVSNLEIRATRLDMEYKKYRDLYLHLNTTHAALLKQYSDLRSGVAKPDTDIVAQYEQQLSGLQLELEKMDERLRTQSSQHSKVRMEYETRIAQLTEEVIMLKSQRDRARLGTTGPREESVSGPVEKSPKKQLDWKLFLIFGAIVLYAYSKKLKNFVLLSCVGFMIWNVIQWAG